MSELGKVFKDELISHFLQDYQLLYKRIVWPIISRKFPSESGGAQEAHEQAMALLSNLDEKSWVQSILGLINEWLNSDEKIKVGGVELSHPTILSAGWVKGLGFESEEEALRAVSKGVNIIPGFLTMPKISGLVEMGSYTKYPLMGNSPSEGVVLWRNEKTRSAQNRIGLTNPGAAAVAEFMRLHQDELPQQFGISIAVRPGITDLQQEKKEVLESCQIFVDQGIYPTWFNINLSCPNTEDDPQGSQTAEKTREFCGVIVEYLISVEHIVGREIPLWIKIGPDLSDEQYAVLMSVFEEVGVKAVVATNTLPAPVPEKVEVSAGLSGAALHERAVEVAGILMGLKNEHGYEVDVIGSGGVEDGETYRNFADQGVKVSQYLTALIFQGPLAGAVINNSIKV